MINNAESNKIHIGKLTFFARNLLSIAQSLRDVELGGRQNSELKIILEDMRAIYKGLKTLLGKRQ